MREGLSGMDPHTRATRKEMFRREAVSASARSGIGGRPHGDSPAYPHACQHRRAAPPGAAEKCTTVHSTEPDTRLSG